MITLMKGVQGVLLTINISLDCYGGASSHLCHKIDSLSSLEYMRSLPSQYAPTICGAVSITQYCVILITSKSIKLPIVVAQNDPSLPKTEMQFRFSPKIKSSVTKSVAPQIPFYFLYPC